MNDNCVCLDLHKVTLRREGFDDKTFIIAVENIVDIHNLVSEMNNEYIYKFQIAQITYMNKVYIPKCLINTIITV